MTGELHILIIWSRARYQQEAIMADIQTKCKILDCYEIAWSDNMVASNFTRFYGVYLPNRSYKEKECGRGKFLLMVLWDENPVYELRNTSRGDELVNANLFDAKSLYRSWTGGGHKIHATNSPQETNHDLTLLLGVNSADWLKTASPVWNGKITALQRDVAGAHGWKSLSELFYVLNNTIDYVVLRNYACLPDTFRSEEHGDIDILVSSLENAVYVMNAEKVHKEPYRVHYFCHVANSIAYFDVRYVGDNYYCAAWEKDILKTRILERECFYVPNAEHYTYSLLYHALIQKPALSKDYENTLRTLCKQIDILDLNNFLKSNGYDFVKPNDLSVFYNLKNAGTPAALDYLRAHTRITELLPYQITAEATMSGYRYFVGNYNGKKVFIKCGGIGDSCANEWHFSKQMAELDASHFLHPVIYADDAAYSFVAFEFVEGTSVDAYLEHSTALQKDAVKAQLLEMYRALQTAQIVHRDIRPNNFVVVGNTIKLFDFQFAVKRGGGELAVLKKNLYLAKCVGDVYKYKWYGWKDSYSLKKTLETWGIAVTDDELLPPDKVFYMPVVRFCVWKLWRGVLKAKRIANRIVQRLW